MDAPRLEAVRALVDALRRALAAHADPAKAAPMRAYMKSALPMLGVQWREQGPICREVVERYPLATFAEWRAAVLRLWREAQFREERYAAIELTEQRQFRAFQTLDSLPIYEEMISTGAWWDLVDPLANHRVGDLLRCYPEQMRAVVLDWSRGPDLWLRRSSILCQNSFKASTDRDLLFACIAPNLADRDFFIRKAIGWALRQYAYTAPDEVRRYVAAHQIELSPLSRREALKHLAT